MTVLSPNDIRALELPDAKDNFVKIVFLVCSFRILSIDSYISNGILFFLDGESRARILFSAVADRWLFLSPRGESRASICTKNLPHFLYDFVIGLTFILLGFERFTTVLPIICWFLRILVHRLDLGAFFTINILY